MQKYILKVEREASASATPHRKKDLSGGKGKFRRSFRGDTRNSHALRVCCCKAAAVGKGVSKTVEAINSVYNTSFSVPCVFSTLSCREAFKRAKEFYSGLLDALNGTGTHPWLALVIGLPAKKRLAIASSLTSGKKLLPDPCPGMVGDIAKAHAELMSSTVQPNSDFLMFVQKTVHKMFPIGWDEGYNDCVESATLPLSAGIGLPRSSGGVSACNMDREEYLRTCNGEVPVRVRRDVNFQVVVADGKARGITITHKEHQFLKPVHATLYNFLSRKDWLLRGDATAMKLSAMQQCADEVIISGDYESATDGLCLEVSETILSRILHNATHIPDSIKDFCLLSMRSRITYPDGSVVDQKRGQLMGNLLSFPLLCLYNYLAFKFFVRRKVPLKINGDDIVFRSRRDEYERWRDGIGELGLKLSAGKTFVHHRFFSINSTYFWASKGMPERLGVLRMGMLRRPDAIGNLGSSHNVFKRPFKGAQKKRVSLLFLKSMRKYLKLSGRSLLKPSPEGLGVRTYVSALGEAGLFERECWYLMNFSPVRDLPKDPSPHNLKGLPDGWERKVSRRPRGWKLIESEFFKEVIELRWSTSVKMESEERWQSYWDEVHAFGGERLWQAFVCWRRSGGYRRSLKLLRSAGWSKSHHPMKLSSSYVYDALNKFRRMTRVDSWWGRKRVGDIRFVRSQLPLVEAVPEAV